MPNRQNPIVLAAMVIADGAWLFTALAVIGFFTNQDGSPLPWFAVFGLLAFGAAVAKFAPLFVLTGHSPAIVQAGVGIVAIYLALAAGTWAERDGFDLAESIRGDDELARAAIIMLTSSDRPGDIARCEELGISAHLIKPVKQSELFNAIGTALVAAVPDRAGAG